MSDHLEPRRVIPRILPMLDDIDMTGLADGDTLIWDATAKKWTPGSSMSVIENVNTVAASGTTQTIPDPTSYTMNHITLSANCALTFPTAVTGGSFILKLIQDSTGGRTVTWPSSSVRRFVAGTAPTLSTAAGAIDLFAVVCDDGAKWDIVFSAKGLS